MFSILLLNSLKWLGDFSGATGSVSVPHSLAAGRRADVLASEDGAGALDGQRIVAPGIFRVGSDLIAADFFDPQESALDREAAVRIPERGAAASSAAADQQASTLAGTIAQWALVALLFDWLLVLVGAVRRSRRRGAVA